MRKTALVQLLAAAVLSVFFSCANTEKDAVPPPVSEQLPVQPAVSRWHFFYPNDDGSVRIKAADTVAEIPPVRFRPWTEAVRVADCSIAYKPTVFLINKCGVFPAEHLKADAHLPVRHELLRRASAGSLYTVDGDYFIRIYQNSVFLPQNRPENKYFLLRTDTSALFYTPVTGTEKLSVPENAQCKVLQEVDGSWYAGFKADSGTDVSFFYIKSPNFSAFTQNDAFKHIEQISAEQFKSTCEPLGYHRMPQMLKELADRIESSRSLYIRVFTADRPHGTFFLKPGPVSDSGGAEEKPAVEADALYYKRDGGKHTAAILLPDGLCAVNTSELGIRMLKLPPLPENFVYTAFFISDTEITAAWEETVFYEVGRSGFFTASLYELL